MNAALLYAEEFELEEKFAARQHEPPRVKHDVSARSRLAARARYSHRGKSAGSFNGPHRRREKRSYL